MTPTDSGVYSSVDRGANWALELSAACRSMDFAEDDGDPGSDHQAVVAFDDRIFVTAEGGARWPGGR